MAEAFRRESVPPERFTVIGISLGSGPAAYVARRFKVGKLLLFSPYKSLRALVGEMPGYGLLVPFLKYEIPTSRYMSELEGTRVTLLHGAKDGTIPLRHSQELLPILPPGATGELITFPEAGHNDLLAAAGRHILPLLDDTSPPP